jgi:uncharacterized OsmC-like protein
MIKSITIKEPGMPYLTKLEDENGRSVVVNSSSKPSDYLSPAQLIQAGLAGCMSMTIKGMLFKNKVSYNDVSVTVNLDDTDGNYKFTYKVDVDSNEDPEKVDEIVKLGASKCYVRNLITSDLTVEEAE